MPINNSKVVSNQMAVEFPANPQEGDQFTSGNYIYTYDGNKWVISGSSDPLSLVVGATGPQGDSIIGATGLQGVANFVASGPIFKGATVVINTDGTVSVVSTIPSPNLTTENYIGIAEEAISDGESGPITIAGGVNGDRTYIANGKRYYVQLNGSLALTPADPAVFAGTSISATEIIVKG